MNLRVYKHTTHYPAYDHTSVNLVVGERQRTTVRLSLHWKWSHGDGGFWFGLRPELEITRRADRVEKLRAEMREARVLCRCSKCGKEEWGEPGLGRPEGWDFIHMMDFCTACVAQYSYKELLDFSSEPTRPPSS
jgi:hypothetical protein